jgi:SAM-dependent methyltransferase
MANKDWSDYYKATKAKPPRPLLVKALEYVSNKDKAIDIGGGALNDTRYLLDQGFDVITIDKSPLVEDKAKNIPSDKLHAYTTSFEDFDFPKEEYNLASAMFALPFTAPEHFGKVFSKIKDSLKMGGIFCGQFFGDRDEWKTNLNMTFHTKEQAQELLNGLKIISFKEDEKDDKTATGGIKHWHVFHVIARKI